jgi:cyclopropane-fatty-acyl-phospholipid synthase
MASSSLARASDPNVVTSLKILDHIFAGLQDENFAVRLWNGFVWGHPNPGFTLVLKHPGSLKNIFLSPSELKMGEAYIFDDFDIEGDIESAARLGDYLLKVRLSLTDKLLLWGLFMRLPLAYRAENPHFSGKGERHSKLRDRLAVTSHYDLSNDFFSLWLDRSLVYSCAYFHTGSEDIDLAQQQKLDYICRKLRLKPGERLLDIGCGWGGLMAHAAIHYGVQSFGITLSVPQAEFARKRFERERISDHCRVEVCDYRDFETTTRFDKIVSVGMFEHVGEALLPEYFRRVWNSLPPGGVFLNHGIGDNMRFERTGLSFIDRYVFPDGELVPLATTIKSAEAVGFEVRDVESLREHYALTLRHWVKGLESKAQKARDLVGDIPYRIWRLYMAASAHGFASGRLNLYQVLLSKPHQGASQLPLTRHDWYSREQATI